MCIAKYEGNYVKEWVDYHLLIGVDRIYFYDNESPDNTQEILKPYIDSGKIVYTLIEGRGRQLDAYNDAIYDLFIQRKGGSHSVFITTGRLAVQKGQWHLIRAFKKVHEVIPDAVLFIFGGGSLENYLSTLIRESNLEDSTYLMEFDPGIVHYLKEADIYVSPSLWEGFSNSILEALCIGMPVISTDCHTGPRELLAPDTDYSYETDNIEYAKYGILVPAGSEKRLMNEPLTADEELLADAMIALAKHPELREKYARATLERAKLFKPEQITSQWESLLKTLTQ